MITILTDKVIIKTHAAGKKYYESRGYLVKSTGIRGLYEPIEINVCDLMPHSNVYISYHCSTCDSVYETRYCRIINRKNNYCEYCNRKYSNIGNTHGSFNKGKTIPSMQGSLLYNYFRGNVITKSAISMLQDCKYKYNILEG